jgi:hypothetical protein
MAPIPCSAEMDPLYDASKCYESLKYDAIPGPVLTDEFIHKRFQSCLNFRGIRRCHYIKVQVAFAPNTVSGGPEILRLELTITDMSISNHVFDCVLV